MSSSRARFWRMKERGLVTYRLCLLLSSTICLAGCNQYLDRRDTILASSGEAVEANVITMAPDPWPPVSRNKNIVFSGERTARAVRRYECGPKSAAGHGGSDQGYSGASMNGAGPPMGAGNGPPAAGGGENEGSC